MKKVSTETAEEKLGEKKRKPSKTYIFEEVLNLAKEKSQARKSNDKAEYERLRREVKRKLRRDKAEWLEKECSKITEANSERKSKEIFDQIKKLKPVNFQAKSLSMNTKECKTLTETKDVLNIWHEYGKELFDATQQQKSTDIACLHGHSIEPSPIIIEVEATVKELKQEKSPGLDCIPAGLFKN